MERERATEPYQHNSTVRSGIVHFGYDERFPGVPSRSRHLLRSAVSASDASYGVVLATRGATSRCPKQTRRLNKIKQRIGVDQECFLQSCCEVLALRHALERTSAARIFGILVSEGVEETTGAAEPTGRRFCLRCVGRECSPLEEATGVPVLGRGTWGGGRGRSTTM